MANKEGTTILASISAEMLSSVNDVVTRTLREAIFEGKLRQGDRLLQDDIATQLGVSRQPVREALRALQSEGLIVQVPRRGMVVKEFTEEDMRENYYLRQLLESEAARLAAGRIEPTEIQRLKAINHAMAQAISTNDAAQLLQTNADFHRIIHEAARMPTLSRLISQLWVGLTIFTPLIVPGRASRSLEEHATLISALEEHDGEKAPSLMRDHIQRAATEYFSPRRPGGVVPSTFRSRGSRRHLTE